MRKWGVREVGRKVDRMEVGLKYPGSLVRRSFKVVLAKRMRVVALWSSPCLLLERSWIHIPPSAEPFLYSFLLSSGILKWKKAKNWWSCQKISCSTRTELNSWFSDAMTANSSGKAEVLNLVPEVFLPSSSSSFSLRWNPLLRTIREVFHRLTSVSAREKIKKILFRAGEED